jgi:phosphatidylserine/phosphatidylglycerophosphate/cardiolipin synthase-like enzyme
MSIRKLLILPDHTVAPLLADIESSEVSLRIKMFLFTEQRLLDAVIAAHKRGVKVQVMLNPSRSSGEEVNEEGFKQLREAGINVKESSPSYKVSHEKSVVIDDKLAYIQSLNWSTHHMQNTRDYAIATTHPKEVSEIIECFENDWSRIPFKPGETAHLVWCPGNGRARIAQFIDHAKHSLFIQNDRYHDMLIVERLIRAAARGVKVHIMSPLPHSLKKDKLVEGIGGLRILHDVGIKVHHLPGRATLHAKMLLADDKRAILGSINLTPGSFDERRELAIEFDDEHPLKKLSDVVHLDWKNSQPIDLSDHGILDELEKRGSGGWEQLVINPEKPFPKK